VQTKGSGGDVEYYIHFIDLDRRLDRWSAATALTVGIASTFY
jgi:hypothetical protein